jgi:flagellin
MTSAEQSGRSITRIDQATDTMNEQQATIGAVHNRLLNAISNEEASTLSHTAAAGRITDADLAQETTMMAALQVKLSAGTAAMGQANGISQSILSLI